MCQPFTRARLSRSITRMFLDDEYHLIEREHPIAISTLEHDHEFEMDSESSNAVRLVNSKGE
jgi:hypothetical protein